MNRLMISAAAVALCLGASAAAAEDERSTTTTVQTPAGTTQTTTSTSTSDDGYTQYRKTVTSTRHYNASAFVAPSGFTYRRFNVGERVPDALLTDSVVLNDYANYQLVAPPAGLTWIRDGDDALLIDARTGEVIQADYDLFQEG